MFGLFIVVAVVVAPCIFMCSARLARTFLPFQQSHAKQNAFSCYSVVDERDCKVEHFNFDHINIIYIYI